MEEQKVLDKFEALYQEDSFKELDDYFKSSPKPEEQAPTPAGQDADSKGHEEGKPAEMGDFGTAFKNIEEAGQVPGYTDKIKQWREESKPTTEELNVSKTGSTMDKLKALPGGVAKAFKMAASNSIPATGGEVGLMVGAGKIFKGVAGGIRAMGQAFRGVTPTVVPEQATLNVGLNVGEKTALSPEQVQAAIEQEGGQVKKIVVHKSNSEPTAVIELHKPLTPEQAHAVSTNLNQDAIAQMVGNKGELHGPNAEKWVPFNPEYFLKSNGKFAAEAEFPKPSDVKTAITMRSAGDNKVAPEEYGTVKKPTDIYKDIPFETDFKLDEGKIAESIAKKPIRDAVWNAIEEKGPQVVEQEIKLGTFKGPSGVAYSEEDLAAYYRAWIFAHTEGKSLTEQADTLGFDYKTQSFPGQEGPKLIEKTNEKLKDNEIDTAQGEIQKDQIRDKDFAQAINDLLNKRYKKRPLRMPQGYEGEPGTDNPHGYEMHTVPPERVTPEFLEKRARAGGFPGLAPIPPDIAQEAALKGLVEAERKVQGSRIVTPNDVSRAIGRDLLPDEDAALKAEGMGDYTSHVFGLAEQATAVKNKVMEEIAKFRGGQLESEDQIKYFFENYISIAAKMENTLEESARALQAGGQADVKIITKQVELLKMAQEQAQSFTPDTPLTGTQIARMIDTLGMGRATQAVKNAKRLGWDMITSHIYFSELSNPRTWEVNTGVSSFVMPFIQAGSIGIGSRLEPRILSQSATEAGQLTHYAPGAAEAHLVGAMDGFMTAVRHVKNSWEGGGIRGLFTDLRNLSPLPYSFAESAPAINTGPTISAENLNRFFANHEKLSWLQFDPHGVLKPMAQLIDAYGEGAHFTRQIMEAGDRMSYLINEHAHRASQAYSRAIEQGLEGKDLIKYYKEQISNPTALIQKAANMNAMHDIFREPIEGFAGGLVKGLGHPAFRPIATYVRTPFNIASVGLEGWPGLNKLVGHIRADYEAGGAREQLARGRWMMGSMITAVGAAMAVGDRFTGYGPLDPQQRAAWLVTHEPFAIKIRDTGDNKRDWVSLKYIQPISTWMGAAADFVQMKAWEEQPEKMAEYMWAPTVAFAHAISNTVFTNDLFHFLDAIQIKPHQSPEQWARTMEQYVENRAKNILSPVPSAAGKALQSIYDPVSREVRGVVDAVKSTIPGWASTLPANLDWLGQEQKLGPAYTMLMTPMRKVDTKYDQVTNDIAKNAPQLLTLPSIVDKTELTSKDVHDFKYIRGNEIKLFGGKKMGDALLDLVNSDQYKKGTEGPHGMQSKLLSSYVAAYTKMTIAKMAQKDPRFYNLAQEFENIESLTGKKMERPSFLKVQPQ